jgi:isocitrate/isopropylmalate dehydrogenase
MLRRLGHAVEAQRVRKAVQKTLRERKVLTPDLGGSAKTMEYAKAIVANFE